MKINKMLLNLLTNRYFIVLAIALIWMLFFDQFDLRSQYQLKQTIKRLNEDKTYYLKEIMQIQQEKTLLENDPSVLEKLAREQYLMKKPHEDLYIIVGEQDAKNQE